MKDVILSEMSQADKSQVVLHICYMYVEVESIEVMSKRCLSEDSVGVERTVMGN